MPILESVKAIEQQYRTGEEPVLVTCSDMNTYVCKYMRSAAPAYKLACELIGARMARAWQIETPEISFVRIKQEHWTGKYALYGTAAPSLGSRRMEGVVDVTPSTYGKITTTQTVLRQLMKIALFDFWTANEDRNANNANLLYDVGNERLVAIDYGCILNTATFDFTISQLTTTDTILWSDLFKHLAQGKKKADIHKIAAELKSDYADCLKRSSKQTRPILDELPKEWNISIDLVEKKLQELFCEEWTKAVWDNFTECLDENS